MRTIITILLSIIIMPITVLYSIFRSFIDPTHKEKINRASNRYDELKKGGYNEDLIFDIIDKESNGISNNHQYNTILDAGKWAVLDLDTDEILLFKSYDKSSVEDFRTGVGGDTINGRNLKLIKLPGEKLTL